MHAMREQFVKLKVLHKITSLNRKKKLHGFQWERGRETKTIRYISNSVELTFNRTVI